MIKRTPRTPKFKDCRHKYRLLTRYKEFFIFYCEKCLIFTAKDEDKSLKKWIKDLVKNRNI